jgi:hypothetical protein
MSTALDRWDEAGRATLFYDAVQLLNRYAHAFDRADWDGVQACFHPDAIDDHGSVVGSPEQFTEVMRSRYDVVAGVSHMNANVLVLEVDRERREVLTETYCLGVQRLMPDSSHIPSLYATSRLPEEHRARISAVANRYLDILSERDGELRIAYRKVIYDWVTVNDYPIPGPFRDWAQGSRNGDDPAQRTLREIHIEMTRLAEHLDSRGRS